jgi:LmbE family N-acetylglucosaminyl deacetylase
MPDASQKAPIQRVLVITAHPDDSEFGAGGTVARLVREGLYVAYCIVTNGDKGSGDRSMTPERLARIRQEEQRNSATRLGYSVWRRWTSWAFRTARSRTRASRAGR